MRRDEAFREAVIRIEDMESKMAYIGREGFTFTGLELIKVRQDMRENRPLRNDDHAHETDVG
jgi:hypothetical protein